MFDPKGYREDCARLALGQEKIEEMIRMTENENKKSVRRPLRVALIAAAAVALLTVTAFAANPEVVEQVQDFIKGYVLTFTALDGSETDTVVGMEGSIETSVIATRTMPPMAYEVRDGRNILTVDGEERDVTEAMEKDGCYETAGEGYSLKLMPDGTALVELDDGLGNSMSYKLLLDAEGVVPDAERFHLDDPKGQWTEEDGEGMTAQTFQYIENDDGSITVTDGEGNVVETIE